MNKFNLGQLVITSNANGVLAQEDVMSAVGRHLQGDWGDVSDGDKQANDVALRGGERLLSSYKDRNGTKFWVITEADRSSTCVLLPEDY